MKGTSRSGFPDFLIVGAQRCGTTSLYMYFNDHPDIYMSPKKETAFFTFQDNTLLSRYKEHVDRSQFVIDVNEYMDIFMQSAINKVAGEATPEYLFFHKESIANIKKYVPNWNELKVVIILRHPVRRAFSHYTFVSQIHGEELTFLEALEQEEQRLLAGMYPMSCGFKAVGLYSSQVEAYLNEFEHVKIVLLEELSLNPNKVVKELFDFLGVDTSYSPKAEAYNQSGVLKRTDFSRMFFNSDNILRVLMRNVIPYPKRVKIRRQLHKILSRQNEATPYDAYDYLMEYYQDEMAKMDKLFKSIQIDSGYWKNL